MSSISVDENRDMCCIIEDTVTYDKNNVKIIRKSAILRNKNVRGYYRYIFRQCDTDGDGLISTTELKQFLVTNEGSIPDQVVECLYRKFDLDKDQQLSFDEFLDLIIHPTVTQAFKRIGSRYLKFVAESSVRKKSLKLARTVTNTGIYEEQIKFSLCTVSIIVLSVIQIICYYTDEYECNHCIRNETEYHPHRKGEIWRFVMFVFDHSNATHLYGNVILQILLGVPLEMVHTWRVPLIYFAGAVGGCLLHSVTAREDGLVGGSPGVYSFYSAHVATVIMNWREMTHPAVHLIIFTVLIGFDAVINYILELMTSMSKISFSSHMGGVVVGLLMGVLVLRNLKITTREIIIWYTCLGILCLLLITFAIWTAVIQP